MMPDMNGFEVCKAIRQTSDVPIIMLTARGDLSDKVVGLEIGADDYLAKPFEPQGTGRPHPVDTTAHR